MTQERCELSDLITAQCFHCVDGGRNLGSIDGGLGIGEVE